MNWIHSKTLGLIVCSGTVLAQGATTDASPVKVQKTAGLAKRVKALPALRSFSDLRNKDVCDRTGKAVATVTDAIIDARTGTTLFAVVTTKAGQHVAVPARKLGWKTLAAGWRLVLDGSAESLGAAPSFAFDECDKLLGSREFRDATHAAFGALPNLPPLPVQRAKDASASGKTKGDTADAAGHRDTWKLAPCYQRATDIGKAALLANPDSAHAAEGPVTAGRIVDVVTDANGRRIHFVVVERKASERVAVPWAAFALYRRGTALGARVFKTAKQLSGVPTLQEAAAKQLAQDKFRSKVCRFFGVASPRI